MVFGAIAALNACSSPHLDADSTVKVVGGTKVEGKRWESSVAILIDNSGLCTGTLVTPTLVITAAHCLDGKRPSTPILVFIGNAIEGGRKVAGKSFAVNPKYVDDAITDIAYIKLATPITDVELIPVLTDSEEIKTLLTPGAPSIMVGFGSTESGQVGVKHEVTTVVGKDDSGALFVGGNGRDSCQGDSGGPAYGQLPNGQFRVYGITSRGNGCGGGGQLARMHDGLCWIQKDAGIAVPGSKLKCDGVVNVPDDTSELSLLLANSSNTAEDDVYVAIAAGKSASKVGLCFGDLATCLTSKSIDLAFETNKTSADHAFYKSRTPLTLRAGLVVTMLAFDNADTVIDVRSVKIELN